MRHSLLLAVLMPLIGMVGGGAPQEPPAAVLVIDPSYDDQLADLHIARWENHTNQMNDKVFGGASLIMGGEQNTPLKRNWQALVADIMSANNYTKIQAVARLFSADPAHHLTVEGARLFMTNVTFEAMQATGDKKLQEKITQVYQDAGGGASGEYKVVHTYLNSNWRTVHSVSHSMNLDLQYYAVTPLGLVTALCSRRNVSIAAFNPTAGVAPLGWGLLVMENPEHATAVVQEALSTFFKITATKGNAWIHDGAVTSLPRLVDLLIEVCSWRWLPWFNGSVDDCLRDLTVHGLTLKDIKFRYCGKVFPLSIMFNGVTAAGYESPTTRRGDGPRRKWRCSSCGIMYGKFNPMYCRGCPADRYAKVLAIE